MVSQAISKRSLTKWRHDAWRHRHLRSVARYGCCVSQRAKLLIGVEGESVFCEFCDLCFDDDGDDGDGGEEDSECEWSGRRRIAMLLHGGG